MGRVPVHRAVAELGEPARGLIVAANEQNFPQEIPIGYDWLAPQRANRIREVLAYGTKWTVEGSLALQVDELNPLARRVVPLLLSGRRAARPTRWSAGR